jgi:hypothetical protein
MIAVSLPGEDGERNALGKGGTTMFWAGRINKIAGVTLVFLAALVIATDVLNTVVAGDSNLLARGDIEDLLRDINKSEALFFLGTAFDIASNVVLLAAAAVLYLLFRDRSRVLALFGAFGFLASGVALTAADAGGLTLGFLAADYVEKGGPGGMAVGDPVILESARAVGAFGMLLALCGLSALGLGLIALGGLLAGAPEGEVNSPRWVGYLSVLAGVGMLLSWALAADWDAGNVISLVGEIGALLVLVILGGWLLIQPEKEVRPATRLAYDQSL